MHGGFHTTCQLILASASPRRQRFLQELGLDFIVEPSSVDECGRFGESPEFFVLRLAEEKAEAVARGHVRACILAADTIVVLDNEILGKPRDAADAEAMLAKMSGKWHEVWTGYCLRRLADSLVVKRAVRTRVLFRPLDADLRRAYVLTGEPLDKAGSYGLQGRGGFLVARIDGSYSNVIGLPVAEVIADLLGLGIILPNTSLPAL
ncbi:MAG: septum formation protein Maf [Deltaproteobacteria bacterium]|nr:septum formation protein Maf [Deltaproteobacteria bacterium]